MIKKSLFTLAITTLLSIGASAQNEVNPTDLTQPPLPEIKYQGVPDIPNNDRRADRSGISVLPQNQIRSTSGTNDDGALTQDLFSKQGTEKPKQRFETYTPSKGADIYTTSSSGELVAKDKNNIPDTDNDERIAEEQATEENWSNDSLSTYSTTGTILTIVGLTIFGLIIRGLLKDKSITDKPMNTYSWIIQLGVSLLVGFIVWSVIPTSCKKSSDSDPADRIIKSRL